MQPPCCIFVNRDWKAQLAPFFGKDTTGTMDLESGDALAIVLLHEVGHIQPAGLPDNPAIAALLDSLGPGKQEEMRADAFAVTMSFLPSPLRSPTPNP